MVVVDVGANLGLFTVIAANKVGNNGHVHSFEPVPSCFDLLEKNCNFYNLQNVTTYQNIVANKKEKRELWMDKYYSILGSLSGENLMNKGKKICIDAITLDGLFMDNNNNHRIDVIKMNIQGAEGLVIEGAKKLLEEKGPAIFIEFWPYGLKQIGTDPEQLYDKLIDYGYKASLISYLDGSTTQISKSDIFPLADIESKKSLALYMLFEKP
jgi:FkbM family methyltransferase